MNLNEYRTKGALGKKTLAKLNNVSNNEDTDVKYTSEFLNQKFNEYNEKYFNGSLEKIPLRWKTMKSKNGYFKHGFNIFSQKIIFYEIALNKNTLTTIENFRNTFVHEMLHYYVNANVTEDQINYANSVGKCGSRSWNNAMEWGDTACHEGTWKRLATELNRKYKELNILRMGGNDSLENRTSTGRIKKQAINVANSGHILIHRQFNHEFFTFVNDETYKQLLKDIKENKTTGDWYEYKFDSKKIAEYGVKLCSSINKGYKKSYFTMLCKEGVIFSHSSKKLEKPEAVIDDNKLKEVSSWHILIHNNGQRRMKILNQKQYDTLLEDIKNNIVEGEYYEYEFDKKKMSLEPLTTTSYFSAYKARVFDSLVDRGIVYAWSKNKLGGSHVETRRERKRNLRNLFGW